VVPRHPHLDKRVSKTLKDTVTKHIEHDLKKTGLKKICPMEQTRT
jgi:hypothetical protein